MNAGRYLTAVPFICQTTSFGMLPIVLFGSLDVLRHRRHGRYGRVLLQRERMPYDRSTVPVSGIRDDAHCADMALGPDLVSGLRGWFTLAANPGPQPIFLQVIEV